MYGVTQTQLSTQQLGACAAAVEISGQQKNVGVAPFPLLPSPLLHMQHPGTTAGSSGAHVGTCLFTYVCIYVCIYICVHVYIHAHVYICDFLEGVLRKGLGLWVLTPPLNLW